MPENLLRLFPNASPGSLGRCTGLPETLQNIFWGTKTPYIDDPKTDSDRLKTAQESLRRPQDGSKMAPNNL